ncbi:MAG: glycosyltransferase, partial [Anaerolineales bacterium]
SYIGGDSHTPDLAMVAPVLVEIAERYPEQVVFRFLGAPIPDDIAALPNVGWTPSTTLDYANFAASLSDLDYDIFIAPLRDNHFNRCKSSIKYLEYSSLGVPGVYSNLPTYAQVVQHGKNGFLASDLDDWLEQLILLVESPELRYEIGQQALETVRAEWLLSKHAKLWMQVYEKVSSKSRTYPSSTQSEINAWIGILSQAHYYEREIKAREQSTEYKAGQWTELKQRHLQIAERLERAESENNSLKWQLFQIEQSRSWKLLITLGNMRKYPTSIPGSIVRIVGAAWRALSGLLPQKRKTRTQVSDDLSKSIEKQIAPRVQLEGFSEDFTAAQARKTPGKYDLIVFPVMDWYSRRQRPQQLALQFAKAGHRVFYLNTNFRDAPVPLVKSVGERIYEVYLPSPHTANVYQDTIDEPMHQEFHSAFEAIRLEFKISHAVCLVDLPFWTSFAITLRREFGWKVIYDCMDYHRGFSTNTEVMLSLEDTLINDSDLVLVTSQFLHEEISPKNPNCLLVPNGAEYDHFHYPVLRRP